MEVIFPDGTRVIASSLLDRDEHLSGRDFGLYLDPRWNPTWPAELIDWPDFELPRDSARAAAQIRAAFSRAKADRVSRSGASAASAEPEPCSPAWQCSQVSTRATPSPGCASTIDRAPSRHRNRSAGWTGSQRKSNRGGVKPPHETPRRIVRDSAGCRVSQLWDDPTSQNGGVNRRFLCTPPFAPTPRSRAGRCLVSNEADVKTLISDIDGFNAYYLVRTAEGAVSISVYDTEAGVNNRRAPRRIGSARTCLRSRAPRRKSLPEKWSSRPRD